MLPAIQAKQQDDKNNRKVECDMISLQSNFFPKDENKKDDNQVVDYRHPVGTI